jgi:hypothetical protein
MAPVYESIADATPRGVRPRREIAGRCGITTRPFEKLDTVKRRMRNPGGSGARARGLRLMPGYQLFRQRA